METILESKKEHKRKNCDSPRKFSGSSENIDPTHSPHRIKLPFRSKVSDGKSQERSASPKLKPVPGLEFAHRDSDPSNEKLSPTGKQLSPTKL